MSFLSFLMSFLMLGVQAIMVQYIQDGGYFSLKPFVNWHAVPVAGCVIAAAVILTGCASPAMPPSTQASTQQVHANTQAILINEQGVPNRYLVKSGDTVSRIAQRYGLNYREIGRLNHLDSRYTIYTGSWLTLWNAHTNTSYLPSNQNIKVAKGFMFPSDNRVIGEFNKSNGIIGMWFEGRLNDPVRASQDGRVIYAGEGLSEYGKLIMIEHSDGVVTAYAHNHQFLVAQDQMVRRGQQIATMGNTAGRQGKVALEFQVRLYGEPIDPRSILSN